MKNRRYLSARTIIMLALSSIQTLAQSTYEPYTFTTLAGGDDDYGSMDGTGSAARFSGPVGVAVDSAGNVYVSDGHIRKVTPVGVVTTLAEATSDAGVAVDSAGNIYGTVGSTILKVTPAGVVTTLAGAAPGYADGTGSEARFANPSGLAVDSAGNVYVSDWGNHTIRKVTPAGVVTTLAGNALIKNVFGSPAGGYADGTGSAARFCEPLGVAVDSAGNVYVADFFNDTIRKVTPAGVVTTLAGLAGSTGSADGTGSHARFNRPNGVAVDSAGNVYVSEWWNHTIRKVTPTGVVTTLAGNASVKDRFGNPLGGYADGTGSAARFYSPLGLAADSAGNVYVADTGNQTIRKVTPTGEVTTLAGLPQGPSNTDGIASAARFNEPRGVAVDSARNVYVADSGNNMIRKVTSSGVVTTLAGLTPLRDAYGFPVGGSADGTGSAARFNEPQGVAVDSAGNVYVADSGNNTIRKVTSAGMVTTLAGLAGSSGSVDGTGGDARFRAPSGVAVDGVGNVYVTDFGDGRIRKITPGGMVSTLAGLADSFGGADGTGSQARFGVCSLGGCVGPVGVAVDSAGNVYVVDYESIRKVTPEGVVTTLAGGRESGARLYGASGVAVDGAGNVYGTFGGIILKVTPAGVVTMLAGLAGDNESNVDGTGSVARFSHPTGVAVDSAGNLYVADTGNSTIRKGYAEPVTAVTLFGLSGSDFRFNGGQFGFMLTGPASKLVVVEASKDLVNWLPLWTNTFAGAIHFSDPQSEAYSNRFYRARLP